MVTISIIFSIISYHLPPPFCSFPSAFLPYDLLFALQSSPVARSLILFYYCTEILGLAHRILRRTQMLSVRQKGKVSI